jgi:hypothetical protein
MSTKNRNNTGNSQNRGKKRRGKKRGGKKKTCSRKSNNTRQRGGVNAYNGLFATASTAALPLSLFAAHKWVQRRPKLFNKTFRLRKRKKSKKSKRKTHRHRQ